jgi:hypothetical protein
MLASWVTWLQREREQYTMARPNKIGVLIQELLLPIIRTGMFAFCYAGLDSQQASSSLIASFGSLLLFSCTLIIN